MRAAHISLVAQREFVENVRTRGFWISLLGLPVLMLVLAVLPALLLATSEPPARFTIVDQSGWLGDRVLTTIVTEDMTQLVDALRAGADQVAPLAGIAELSDADADKLIERAAPLAAVLLRDGGTVNTSETMDERFADWFVDQRRQVAELTPDARLVRFPYVASPGSTAAELRQAVLDERLLGYFVIPDDPVASSAGAAYVTSRLTQIELRSWFDRLVTAEVRQQRLRERNLDAATVAWINEPIGFPIIPIGEDAEVEETLSVAIEQWAPAVFVYLLWIAVFAVSQMLLTSTIEEKTNKLAELLLSSVHASDLMLGKILGIALTGLTVVLVWVLLATPLLLWLPSLIDSAELDLSTLLFNPTYLPAFILYFVLGYLFYGTALSAIGAQCNTLKEAQTLLLPIQLVLVLPLVLMLPIARDPNGTLAVVLSYVPPLTPFVMMNRAAGPPSVLTYVLTTALLVISIVLLARLAQRLFARGMLQDAPAPSLGRALYQLSDLIKRQFFRALRRKD